MTSANADVFPVGHLRTDSNGLHAFLDICPFPSYNHLDIDKKYPFCEGGGGG